MRSEHSRLQVAATVLLASQRVDPRVLLDHQFAFDFPTLDSALEDIVGGTAVAISPTGRVFTSRNRVGASGAF